MGQQAIITDYPDARVMSNIRNSKGIPVFKKNDTYTATRVTTWYDGSAMTPEKADGLIYMRHKSSGDYYLANLPNWGETFLEKDAIVRDSSTPSSESTVRELTSTEILLLKMKYYKGVKVNGYYKNGDTPRAIEYLLSSTSEADNGANVIEVGGIKLEHEFIGTVDVIYFGIIPNDIKWDFTKLLSLKSIRLEKGKTYNYTPFTLSTDDFIFDFNNSVLYCDETITVGIEVTSNNVQFLNCGLDAVSTVSRQVRVLGDNFFCNDVVIKNGFYGIELSGDNPVILRANCFDTGYSGVRINSPTTKNVNSVTIGEYYSYKSKIKGLVINSKGTVKHIDIGYIYSDIEGTTDNGSNGFLIDPDNDVNTLNIESVRIGTIYNIGGNSGACKFQNVRDVVIDNLFDYKGTRVYSSPYSLALISTPNCRINNAYLEDRINLQNSSLFIDNLRFSTNITALRPYSDGYVRITGNQEGILKINNLEFLDSNNTAYYIIRYDNTNENYKVVINNLNKIDSRALVAQVATIPVGSFVIGRESKSKTLGGLSNLQNRVLKQPDMFISTTVPTIGKWKVGDIVFKEVPTATTSTGANGGWICVTAGDFSATPPVFQPFAIVGQDIDKRQSGTTAQRPVVTTQGYKYYDTTLGKPVFWSGSTWVDLTPNASTAVKGLVNQSAKVDNIASANATTDTESTATDVAGLVADFNDLVGKYNSLVTLANELKTQLNSHFTNERTSGQQSTT